MTASSHVQSMGWTTRDFAATFQRMIHERYVEVGRRVRELREARGLSQEALAGLAGLSSKTISRVESPPKNGAHETRGGTHRKLAAALETTVGYLREPLAVVATITINPPAEGEVESDRPETSPGDPKPPLDPPGEGESPSEEEGRRRSA